MDEICKTRSRLKTSNILDRAYSSKFRGSFDLRLVILTSFVLDGQSRILHENAMKGVADFQDSKVLDIAPLHNSVNIVKSLTFRKS